MNFFIIEQATFKGWMEIMADATDAKEVYTYRDLSIDVKGYFVDWCSTGI